jgi:predicted molibdopterin-dependent oxidoreductase YjgC
MTTGCRILVDGVELEVAPGTSVAAALMNAQLPIRQSVSGEPRGALCGMGICHECRLSIDGKRHVRSCMTLAAPGMVISTHD